MLQVIIIASVLLAIALVGLAIGVIFKGKFPETHVGHNPEMKKLGITCAKNDKNLCQGRPKTTKFSNCCSHPNNDNGVCPIVNKNIPEPQ